MMRPDPRQFDMFAAMVVEAATPDPVAIPPEVQADFAEEDYLCRFNFGSAMAGWSDEQRDAWRRSWDLNKREYARGNVAEAEGRIEVLGWGAGSPGKHMSFGKPGYQLRLWNDFGRWRIREQRDLHNSGSSGPFHGRFASRTEAMLHAFRRIVADAAREEALAVNWQDTARRAKQLAQLANWCCQQLPPLVCGVDLGAEWAQLRQTYKEREALRVAAIHAGDKDYVGEDGHSRPIVAL